MILAVVGASGFVGQAVAAELRRAGHEVLEVVAPRLASTHRDVTALVAQARSEADVLEDLLPPCDAIVNAAGLAEPGAPASDALFGANALLPGVLAVLAARHGARLVHLSSAAVHGSARVLDETRDPSPESAYGESKLAGERVAVACGGPRTVAVYRPTSVQGAGRQVTQALARLARSPLASVAGRGAAPTPQALVDNVAVVCRYLVESDDVPPRAVLHPWEGLTTSDLLAGLGGRRPVRIPVLVARPLLSAARMVGRLHPGVLANARRLEMLWFGQQQRPGWLDARVGRLPHSWTEAFDSLGGRQDGSPTLHVGLLTQWYDPEPGPASIPGVLARGLVARGHTVSVLTGQPNYPTGAVYPGYAAWRRTTATLDGVRVRRVPLYPSHDASTLRRIANYASFAVSALVLGVGHLRRCDVLWVYNSPPTVALPLAALRWLFRRPTVLHVMDVWPESLYATGFAPRGRVARTAGGAIDALSRATYALSSRVAYIAPSVGPLLEARGVARDKLEYVPVWTDEAVFFPRPRGERDRWPGNPKHRVLLYAGAIGGAQGLDTLVDAMSLVQDEPVVCLIAGDGTERVALEAQVAQRGLTNVHFLGPVGKDRIGDLMAVGDIHVISLTPSALGNVSLPSKLQATTASGKPILAIASGDLAAVVDEGGIGRVVPPGSPQILAEVIREIARLPEESIDDLARAARDYYERELSAATGVDRTERLLRAALAAPSIRK